MMLIAMATVDNGVDSDGDHDDVDSDHDGGDGNDF